MRRENLAQESKRILEEDMENYDFLHRKQKYPMGDSQPAQIDCRDFKCKFYVLGGDCNNISPALTLNPNKTFVCWSRKDRVNVRKDCNQYFMCQTDEDWEVTHCEGCLEYQPTEDEKQI